jgi:hypothetical protein
LSDEAEYHLRAWRNHSYIQAGLANAEIRSGDSQLSPVKPRLLSLKCKFDSWDSASKLMPIQRNYADGASATEIGATFPEWLLDVWRIPVNPNFEG